MTWAGKALLRSQARWLLCNGVGGKGCSGADVGVDVASSGYREEPVPERAGRRRCRVREGRRGVFGVRSVRRGQGPPPAPMRWSRCPPFARSRRRRFRGRRVAPTSVRVAPPTTCRPARPVGGYVAGVKAGGAAGVVAPGRCERLGWGGRWRGWVVRRWGPGGGGRPASWRVCRRASMAASNGRVSASAAGDGGILGSHRRPRRRAGGRDGTGLRTH